MQGVKKQIPMSAAQNLGNLNIGGDGWYGFNSWVYDGDLVKHNTERQEMVLKIG